MLARLRWRSRDGVMSGQWARGPVERFEALLRLARSQRLQTHPWMRCPRVIRRQGGVSAEVVLFAEIGALRC